MGDKPGRPAWLGLPGRRHSPDLVLRPTALALQPREGGDRIVRTQGSAHGVPDGPH